jgi:tetratricopeptide (TPR) repeat protein
MLIRLLIIKGYAPVSASLFCCGGQYSSMQSPPQEDTASYWQKLGNSLANAGRYEEAAKAYDKSLKLDPKDTECWNNRGIILSILNRINDAIQSFEKATTIDPQNAEAWYNRGMVFCSLERYEDAIESLNKALEIDPQSAYAWHNKGVALKRLGRDAEARFAFVCAGRIGTA